MALLPFVLVCTSRAQEPRERQESSKITRPPHLTGLYSGWNLPFPFPIFLSFPPSLPPSLTHYFFLSGKDSCPDWP